LYEGDYQRADKGINKRQNRFLDKMKDNLNEEEKKRQDKHLLPFDKFIDSITDDEVFPLPNYLPYG
jgi:hypothetical protein